MYVYIAPAALACRSETELAYSCFNACVVGMFGCNPLIDVMVFCEWRWDGAGGKWYEDTDTKEEMRRHQ